MADHRASLDASSHSTESERTSSSDSEEAAGSMNGPKETIPSESHHAHHQQGKDEMEDSEDQVSYSGFDETADLNVRKIAREISYRKINVGGNEMEEEAGEEQVKGINPFDGTSLQDDPRLDPNSPSFEPKTWIRNLRAMRDADPDHFHHTSLGVAFKDLRAFGRSSDADYQATAANVPFKILGEAWNHIVNRNDTSRYFDILKPMEGLLKKGTVTVVLGRPGAGCTTLLKTIASHTHGFHVAKESVVSYDGMKPSQICNNYRGDVTYSAESDTHFPHLTVGQTLTFAAKLRAPKNRPVGISRDDFAEGLTQVYMAMYGLSHTYNTKVGNNFIRGVSGGERKRVSIAEVSICGSYLQCWDNATRGLDSATALEFVRALRTQAEYLDITSAIAIYQCSQEAYDLFDNCILLYEGYQIWSGPASLAKDYFERMGYQCPARQPTPDFLTSLTSPSERIVRKGFSKKVPRTPKEFYDYWRASPERASMLEEVEAHLTQFDLNHPKSTTAYSEVSAAHKARQGSMTSKKSPYTVSFASQVWTLTKRNWLRTRGSPQIAVITLVAQAFLAITNGALFYNQAEDTSSFYSRGSSLLVAIVLNCVASILEILSMFEARPILEKHSSFGLYRASANAVASVISELPLKVIATILFNVIYYFMINFKRQPGPFFFFLLFNFMGTLCLSHVFRTIGSFFDSLAPTAAPIALAILIVVIFSGFPVPTPNMLGWSRWIAYLNPMTYSFEAMFGMELHGRNLPCAAIIPSGPGYNSTVSASNVCAVVGAVAGQSTVSGDAYLAGTYDLYWSNAWRNFGILILFTVAYFITYILATEWTSGPLQRGEITLFPRSKLKKRRQHEKKMIAANDANGDANGNSNGRSRSLNHSIQVDEDVESSGGLDSRSKRIRNALVDDGMNSTAGDASKIQGGSDIFHWRDVCYDVQIGPETRRLLNHVDGWVKPGTLTALMGSSGAGKTTLLDVLASRVTMGTIYGHMFVNGHQRGPSFQRSTGYAQQQDLHLQTSTVREALRFSAYLRQPSSVSTLEKNEYVETIISILEMDSYADAVVGTPGEGLNVEQRKRLTIGVELAAKPKLLLFLDEPTSGLDSQTAWSVCQLMRKLANHGQAILCTIHQPSALLFQEFDRLLFLARGGRTVYFGDIGKGASTLIRYFESHGAPPCPPEANPAEWMLSIVGAGPVAKANQDYHQVWTKSKEYKKVKRELAKMERDLPNITSTDTAEEAKEANAEFAAGMLTQYLQVTKRMLQCTYRNPIYIWSKLALGIFASLLLGFIMFKADLSIRGMENQMICALIFTTVLPAMVQQLIPQLHHHRDLFEVRERPSKMYSWFPWVMAQITSELPWQLLIGTLAFICWFYPVGFYRNMEVTHTVSERSALTWLNAVTLYMFITTYAQACTIAFDSKEIGGQMAIAFFSTSFHYSGILRYPHTFWKFIYRATPFTYYAPSIISALIGDSQVTCADTEIVSFTAPFLSDYYMNASYSNTTRITCGEYMQNFIDNNGGYLTNAQSNTTCNFCTLSSTNAFIRDNVHSSYDLRWQNWGIFFCYLFINMIICVLAYWIFRVPKKDRKVHQTSAPESDSKSSPSETENATELENINHGDVKKK